jgi:hypothetical protein
VDSAFAVLKITADDHRVQAWHDTATEAIAEAASLNDLQEPGVIYRAVDTKANYGHFVSLTGESLHV